MGKLCVSVEDMNDAGHILMNQAYQLEFSGVRKCYGEGYWRYSFCERGCGHGL